MPAADQPTVTLSSGAVMPQLGYGVFRVPLADTAAAVRNALEVGYRSIDTAAMYRNEAGVGRAIAESGLPREQVFVTTKLNNDAHGRDNALRAFEHSRNQLGLDYVDLYLIHWPLPAQDRYVETWRALIELQESGAVRDIGVSNFSPAHLNRVIEETGVTPALNQVELHPYLTQDALREYDTGHKIATEAWSPLAKGGDLLADRVLTSLAEKYGKTPAQVVVRWHLDLGNVVIPKSITPARIRENFDVLDFELDGDDVNAITDLNRDARTGPDPDRFGS